MNFVTTLTCSQVVAILWCIHLFLALPCTHLLLPDPVSLTVCVVRHYGIWLFESVVLSRAFGSHRPTIETCKTTDMSQLDRHLATSNEKKRRVSTASHNEIIWMWVLSRLRHLRQLDIHTATRRLDPNNVLQWTHRFLLRTMFMNLGLVQFLLPELHHRLSGRICHTSHFSRRYLEAVDHENRCLCQKTRHNVEVSATFVGLFLTSYVNRRTATSRWNMIFHVHQYNETVFFCMVAHLMGFSQELP